MRLFAAIVPPSEALDQICAVQRKLHGDIRQKGSYPARERLHLTVKFWGDVDKVEPLMGELADLALSMPVMHLRFATIDGFPPNARMKRVAFLKPDYNVQLTELMRRLSPGEDPHPHMTLARFMQPAELPRWRFDPIEFAADRLLLINSEQFGPERRYTVKSEWAFQ